MKSALLIRVADETAYLPWIGVDLDGTLARSIPDNDYSDPTLIGPPIPEMVERIRKGLSYGERFKIITARMADKENAPIIAAAISAYTLKHVGVALEATNEKDPGMVEQWDDKAREVIPDKGEFRMTAKIAEEKELHFDDDGDDDDGVDNAGINEDGYWAGAGNAASGILAIARDTKRICLAWRSAEVHTGDCWGTIGGAVKDNLTPAASAKAEMKEEVGYRGAIELHAGYVFRDRSFSYYNFVGLVDSEFAFQPAPSHAWETDHITWETLDDIRQDMKENAGDYHPELINFFRESNHLIETLVKGDQQDPKTSAIHTRDWADALLSKLNDSGSRYPDNPKWIDTAKAFLWRKWRERAEEMGRPEPTDLSTACKFASLFAQNLFGGEMRGNYEHQFLVTDDGTKVDLTDNRAAPSHHDKRFWMNSEHQESMRSVVPRVNTWVIEFRARYPINKTAATSASGLKDLAARYEAQGISINVYEGDYIVLSSIKVPKEMRKNGIGSHFMQDLVAYADRVGKTIFLTPSTDFGATSVSRLKEFYRRFGFKPNKGRNKDFRAMESMVRVPNTVKTASIPLGDFSQGKCHVFALALNKVLGFEIQAVWDNEYSALVHAYAVRPDGTLVDVTGTITEEDAMYDHGECEDPEVLDLMPEEVRRFSTPKKWGAILPSDLKQAEDLIQANRDVYRDGVRHMDVDEDDATTQPKQAKHPDLDANYPEGSNGWTNLPDQREGFQEAAPLAAMLEGHTDDE